VTVDRRGLIVTRDQELEEIRHLLADLYETKIVDITDLDILHFLRAVERRGLVLAFPVRLR
jgi:hypothetical protein